ncbi:Casein kinase I [Tritrichomonas foetus]|uniref:non-specific serine/threonine protein kinase n=1 Tax=Tritrichomonas foetus TaxID=1144522 RepID=A0A1J4JXN7_9EUKA|nr:Casein kinase I [Tritrichomonas foetus]|eukprot:OHT03442.1 Casein kinase I [Tritrichomonas foetus]
MVNLSLSLKIDLLEMSLKGTIIAESFLMGEPIGKGSFGETYHAINIGTQEEVAIKTESINTKAPQLQYEAKIYKFLAGGFGVPIVHCYGYNRTHNFMVMDILGNSLENLFEKCNRKFSLKTVLMLADQMISCIQFVHSKNYIHRDIKPDNFMMGVNENSNLVFLIDYGLTKNYRDPRTKIHIPYNENNSLTGTARYASINALSGIEQSRRDDLECLGYVWAYFLRGSLPWMGIDEGDKKNKYKQITEVKSKTSVEELFSGFPQEFVEYMYMVKQMRFSDQPNYSQLRGMLRNAFINCGYIYDYVYDWSEIFPCFEIPKVPKPVTEKPLSRLQDQKYCKYPITENDLFPIPKAPAYIEPVSRKIKKSKSSLSSLPKIIDKRTPSKQTALSPRRRP